MKKIINGKKYDTETATCVGDYWNGLAKSDFGNCSESLYKKKTGEFFLYGEGGPLSKYAEHNGSASYGSEVITPLSEEEARMWAEDHLDADEYINIFGDVEE